MDFISRLHRKHWGAVAIGFMAALLSMSAWANTPVTGAAFTTVNEGVDGAGHCQNGNPNVNCNIYDGKEYVWLNGGPSVAYVGEGDYFFAVLIPGGQVDPNDGAAKNLSDDFDAYTNRTFSVSGSTVTYGGTHDFDSNKIRLMPYADTTNPGGVYIMAVCSLADGYPVNPNDCKYDAFKIEEETRQEPPPLTITKDAFGSFDRTYKWTITKGVDKTTVKQVGGTVTFNYTVTVSHDSGTVGNFGVNGSITVFNPNDPLAVAIDGVTDQITDGQSNVTNCPVTGGGAQNLTQLQTAFTYGCSLGNSLPPSPVNNTATVTWPEQILDNGNGDLLAGDSADFSVQDVKFTENAIDECVNVTDSYAGTLGTVCVGDANPKSFTYSRTVTVPTFDCVSYDNTATFTTNDSGVTDSASQTVQVCGPVKTGALTIGFWQNMNGQNIIKGGAATAGVCNSGTWLRQYAPFQDLSAAASCTQVATYVYNVIKAASCTSSSSTCNSMLKAQMLATSLDVYFSDPALGTNKIGAPAPIGGVAIDLTKICTNIPTCSNFENDSSVFGGATSLTVSQILAYAASQSNVGGSTWYGNVKANQVKAKNVFDAINNQVAFAP
jgi:hypothetical protein